MVTLGQMWKIPILTSVLTRLHCHIDGIAHAEGIGGAVGRRAPEIAVAAIHEEDLTRKGFGRVQDGAGDSGVVAVVLPYGYRLVEEPRPGGGLHIGDNNEG